MTNDSSGDVGAVSSASDGSQVQVFVFIATGGEESAEPSWHFPLRPNRWERLRIPLLQDWRGQGLEFEAEVPFGLMEIVGMRLVSDISGTRPQELLTTDLIAETRVLAGVPMSLDTQRLCVLCNGDPTRILLPKVDLPGSEGNYTLEVGLRLRTEPALIGCALRQWADDVASGLHDALARTALAHASNERQTAVLRGQMEAAESARALAKAHEAAVLSEIEAARADGDRRETALRHQLADSHEAARAHAATLIAEIAGARAYGEERAATLTSALEGARAHGDERVAAVGQQLEHGRNEFLAAEAQCRTEIDALRAELRAKDETLSGTRKESDSARRSAVESRQDAEADRGRVRSMQRSISWRITLPLRIVHRVLTRRRAAKFDGIPSKGPEAG